VTVATSGAGALARGLLEGQLAQTLEIVRVLRRARLELERAGGRRGDDVGELGWSDLEPGERALCPPLLLLASEEALDGPELGTTLAALDSELPLKVFALTSSGAASASAELALTAGQALAAQSSIAGYDHLGEALGQAFAHQGPAFVRILAPSPARGGFAAGETLERARAVELALWISVPEERTGGSFVDLLEQPAAAEEPEPAETVVEPPVAPTTATAELEQRHAAELAAMRGHYEAHIAQLRAGLKTEMAQQVRGKLMQLVAGARASAAPSDSTNGQSLEADKSLEAEE
jgi:hypothetical protein